MKPASRLILPALTAMALALAAGCAAPSRSGSVYSDRDARLPMQVQTGTVLSIREVRIERAQPSGVGSGAGAVVGGVAGSTVGGGRGSIVGAVVGAVIGGVAGSHIEKNTTDRLGLEFTVRTDDGRTLAVVQEADGQRFDPGQRVRLLTDPRGQVRVSPN
jgi:outer membrane lipoprotein SlyB